MEELPEAIDLSACTYLRTYVCTYICLRECQVCKRMQNAPAQVEMHSYAPLCADTMHISILPAP